MALFTWSWENEVFLAQVDAEHRDLFRLADELQDAVARDAPPDDVCEHLHRLASKLDDHFSHEESLMRSAGYPSYGWHRAQHDTVRRRLKLLVPLVEAGDKEAAELLLEFLCRLVPRPHHSGGQDDGGIRAQLRTLAPYHFQSGTLG
jgi:hemerythrin